jgi:enoyl-CoA hydratase/carnithine racemase
MPMRPPEVKIVQSASSETTVIPGSPAVLVEEVNGVLWLRLNRPQRMNAINQEMLVGLNQALDAVARSPSVRAVVITGEGRAFSAGVDLAQALEEAEGGWPAISALLANVGQTLERVTKVSVPVIAAVNGVAVAGGLELVLCCDLVLAARSARLGDGHANYGLLPGAGGSVRLTRRIGANRAKQMLFTGEMETAEAMKQAGLVNEVVDDALLLQRTRELLDRITGKSMVGLAHMKRLVDAAMDDPLELALRNELLAFEAHSRSPDLLEGLRAFREKRPPRFGSGQP